MTTIEAVAEKRLSAREQVCRDDEIVKARMRGMTWPTIANRFGLTERRCQQVMAEFRESHPTARSRSPLELLDEVLEGYEAAREDFAEIAATTTHDATRLGAIRSSVAVLEEQVNLLINLGIVPTLLELRQEVNAREVARKMMVVLDEFDASEEMLAAMIDALDGGRLLAPMSANGADAD